MAAELLRTSFFTFARAASSSTTSVPMVLISVHSIGFCIDSGTLIMRRQVKDIVHPLHAPGAPGRAREWSLAINSHSNPPGCA